MSSAVNKHPWASELLHSGHVLQPSTISVYRIRYICVFRISNGNSNLIFKVHVYIRTKENSIKDKEENWNKMLLSQK